MPDGRLLHLRDTYPIETAWAPPYVGDELRQARAAGHDSRLAGLRASAEATAAGHRCDHDTAARQQELAASYQALHDAYRQRETVFAATMVDRADWDAFSTGPRSKFTTSIWNSGPQRELTTNPLSGNSGQIKLSRAHQHKHAAWTHPGF
jgi:hypothetical protein